MSIEFRLQPSSDAPSLFENNNSFNPFFVVVCIETGGLSEVRPVELMQDQAQCILADYVRHRYKTFTKIFDPIIFE